MDYQDKAKSLVVDYFNSGKTEYYIDAAYHNRQIDEEPEPDRIQITAEDVYIVWFCKTLQNWKALLTTAVPDNCYYEVTHNGNLDETYLDVYKKADNVVVKGALPRRPTPAKEEVRS